MQKRNQQNPKWKKRNNTHQQPVSYTHLRAHETRGNLVCRLLLEKKKRKETHFSKARQGRIKHMSKISESISQKRRGHLDFCAVKCKNHGLASWLLGSECVRFWALNLTYHWFYAVCFSNICVKLCTRMPWSTWKRLCHPLALFMSVSMIPNMWHSSCYCMRHWWLTKIGDLCLNQLVVADPPPPFWLLFCISCYNWF